MDENEMEELIKTMEPKILKSLPNTMYQEQEDLKQELYLKMIETIVKQRIKEVDGFWDFKQKCEE